ncbi:MAG: CDP-diacylglycerol--serine O-phosphatidyltransferase [Deltaproteobacteria bacterium]|nr:CDP-diacylglycerol--serine O-phosphatidyltransferase [Deltaproteobacteria bacterium]
MRDPGARGAGRRRGERSARSVDMRKGIYLLPNLCTSMSIVFGFWSVVLAASGRVEAAAWKILWCFVFDGLDGRIARLTRTTSKFGVEFDSLADVVSFGMAPAFLVFQWGLRGYGRWGWIAACIFLIGGAVRLARFNVQVGTVDSKRFVGLPIPLAASVLVTTILLVGDLGRGMQRIPIVLGLPLALAFLMVSTLPYRSFKEFDPRARHPVGLFFAILAVVMLAVAETKITLFTIAIAYALSGPITWVLTRMRVSTAGPGRTAAAGPPDLKVVGGARAGDEGSADRVGDRSGSATGGVP